MFGRKFTEEERKKFGSPGEKNPRHGIKLSDDLKSKISDKVKEAMKNPEIKEKLKRKKSEEHKKKLSQSRIGINKGKTYEEIYGKEKAKLLKEHKRLNYKNQYTRNKI